MRRDIAKAATPALLSALVIGAVGALALLANQPWLFPSLGPTVFLLAVSPREPASRPWNVFAGHAMGVAAGLAALYLCGAQDAPSVFDGGALPAGRVAATALAVGATILFQLLAEASHPPAAATTMLITLGGVRPGWGVVAAIAAGVALAAAPGYAAEAFRRRRPVEDRAPQKAEKQPDFEPGR